MTGRFAGRPAIVAADARGIGAGVVSEQLRHVAGGPKA